MPAFALRSRWFGLWLCVLAGAAPLPCSAQNPDAATVKAALARAVKFYHEQVATHGGYVYQYSADLTLREAEGIPDRDTIWVQPPGTPAVGEALLEAYQATGDSACLVAAVAAARALTRGQLHSGGWDYNINFNDPAQEKFRRRDNAGKLRPDPTPPNERAADGGWATWRQRKYLANLSTLDDDVSFAALRFLTKVDAAQKFTDAEIHESAEYGLTALIGIQYPNGGWSANWDRYPAVSPSVTRYPLVKASYPATWSKTWTKDFTGCYVTNDELMTRAIDTLLLAAQVYEDPRYRAAAERAGRFLIDAQLPDPQPIWAQQYDAQMQPVWGRAFEPPAVTSRESERIIASLLALHAFTKDAKYLAPIPPALAYLNKSLRPDGKLSRFYELQTNTPIYFSRGPGGKGHVFTYSDRNLASNYGFVVDSELDLLAADLERARAGQPLVPLKWTAADLAPDAKRIVAALDNRGAWTEPGIMRNAEGRKVEPAGGIIRSQTFINNVRTLCEYLDALSEK